MASMSSPKKGGTLLIIIFKITPADHKSALSPEHKNYELLAGTLKNLRKRICTGCQKIVTLISEGGLCKVCSKNNEYEGKIESVLSDEERRNMLNDIEEANKTRLTIVPDIPKQLAKLWSSQKVDVTIGILARSTV